MNLPIDPIDDGDRELWLSRFVDGELSPEEKQAVAEKIRLDSVWRAEFEELNADSALVARVVERYHGDSPMAREVVRRIEAMPKRTHSRMKLARRSHRIVRRRASGSFVGFLFKMTGAAALVAASVYGWRYYHPVPIVEPDTVAYVKTPEALPSVVPTALTNELAYTRWPDGTEIWSRRGSMIERVSDRAVKLTGEAFFHVAANPIPFTVHTPNGAQAQALGTRFDVKTSADGAAVRVAEGHVRCQSGTATAEAYGGTEILADLRTQAFDPRTLSSEWSKFARAAQTPPVADSLIPAWAQSGGSQGHTNVTPLFGSAGLVAKAELFLALPETSGRISSAAVITSGATPRAYVLVRNPWESTQPESAKQTTLMSAALNGPARGEWKACLTFSGYTDCAPVLTPRGLVVCATPEGVVKAFDTVDEKLVWTVSVNSPVFALTAANNESILCSTDGVFSVDGHNGIVQWRSGVAQNVKAPVSVLADGTLCAVSEGGVIVHLDAGGRMLTSKQWRDKLTHAPVTSASGDAVWLVSENKVARLSLHDGVLTEKTFGKLPVCGPTSGGLLGSETGIVEFAQQRAVSTVRGDTIIALTQDGHGDLYAGYKNGVLHQRASTKEPEFAHISRGEVLPDGISIIGGLVVVTTTQGVQVFE